MAVNDSRSMNEDFFQGAVDNTYIQIAPDRGGILSNPPLDRLTWPTYGQAEQHVDHPFGEAHASRAHLPRERKNWGYGTDSEY